MHQVCGGDGTSVLQGCLAVYLVHDSGTHNDQSAYDASAKLSLCLPFLIFQQVQIISTLDT